MSTWLKKRLSLLLVIAFTIVALTGCAAKEAVAAKQIESYMQQQEQQVKSFSNIDIDRLDAQNAMEIIKELASEKYKGRKTGTEENEKAVKYVADYFKEIGLKNPEGLDNYLQPYYQAVTRLEETPKLELTDKDGKVIKSYEYPKSFVFKVLSDSTEDIKLQVPMQVMNSAADIKGSSFEDGQILLFSIKAQGRSTSLQLMREAYSSKASAVIVEVDVNSENRRYSDLVITPLNNVNWGEKYKPVIAVDSQTFAELSAAAQENKSIRLQCSYNTEESYKAYNIVGYIPGSDEKLKNEYIIVTGHMDHVGDNFNGTYNPGALDNASGTAAMIEIARMTAQNPVRPKKSMVFIAFNGEESFMNGSNYYVEAPVFPLKNAVLINLDMVGPSYKLPLSVANSNEYVADLKLEFLELAKLIGLEAVSSTINASDHMYFGEKGVPAVMLSHFDVMHGYHSPNDTVEDIDPERLAEAIKLVLYYIDKKAY